MNLYCPEGVAAKPFKSPARRKRAPMDGVHPAEVYWNPIAHMLGEGQRLGVTAYIYFAEEEDEESSEYGLVKIGTAVNPIKRRRELQTGNPRLICLRHLAFGGRELEHVLHRRCRGYAVGDGRIRTGYGRERYERDTEWFRPPLPMQLAPQLAQAQLALAEPGMSTARWTQIGKEAIGRLTVAGADE